MSWKFSHNWNTLIKTVEEIKKDYEELGWKVLEQCLIRTDGVTSHHRLWLMLQGRHRKEIVLCYISKQGSAFAYDSISQYKGPLHYDCPRFWLAQVPIVEELDTSGACKSWRTTIEKNHTRPIGKTFEFDYV